ncbi:MAG: DUF4132 domain-containing protein [Promicromonosporaceae bacterium]|nr:DUF4132 domain-containing protein [Promicromonosporaceae bacterium]
MSILGRVKGALAGDKPNGLLREALEPLKAESEQLFERALAYVHAGDEANLVYELEQAKDPRLNTLLGEPGTLKGWYPEIRGTAADTLRKIGVKPGSVQGRRNRFYGTNASPEQFARFGRLLAAVALDVNRTVKGAPVWLTALLNDVTGTYSVNKRDYDLLAKRLPQWRAEFVVQIAAEASEAELGGLTPGVVAILALCQEAELWHGGWEPHLLPGLDDLLAAHGIDLTPVVASKLNAEARAFLAERAEKVTAVREALAPVVAAFTIDGAKGVRPVALRALAAMTDEQRAQVLPPVLAKATTKAGDLVEWLGRNEVGAALLAEAVAAGAKVGALVEQAAQRREAIAADTVPDEPLVLPPWEPIPDVTAGEAVIAEVRRALDAEIARCEASIAKAKAAREKVYLWQEKHLARARSVTQADIADLIRVANGEVTKVDRSSHLLRKYNSYWIAEAAPSLNLIHLLRLAAATRSNYPRGIVRQRIDDDTDLRVIADAATRSGINNTPAGFVFNPADLFDDYESISAEAAWPYFAERPDVLEHWLTGDAYQVNRALRLLQHFPVLPAAGLPKVAAVALGDSKTNRPLAQAALSGHPAKATLAEQGLASGKGEIRAAAAGWLAAQDDPVAIAPLRAALRQEKRDPVRAALLTALETLGDDISGDLAPNVLTAEAIKGLKAAPPASFSWFPLDAIPAARWADGSLVDPQIIRWWFVFAVKLKEPDGTVGLFGRYLSRLHPEDAAEIGRHALRSWIAYDTRHPAEEESREHAATEGEQQYRWAQSSLANARRNNYKPEMFAYYEQAAAIPLERQIALAYQAHQKTYLGSAVADKGLLALTTRLPGIELATAVQAYIRDHGGRRSQVESLVTALYANGDPAAIQLLLSISRRFKQATVQAKARELVERLAEQRGWTPDELADRTIPTAGFGKDRLLRLDYGPREFLGRVGPGAKIELSDADGKPLKALPSPRVGDDEELVTAAKKQLTTARKELKAVLTLQTARLYEAMCAGRTWSAADFTEFLAVHPLVSQLITRLVWLENPGPAQRAFRPAEDGEFIDASDESVMFDPQARIGLAHHTLLPAAEVEAWRTHLADYEVTPLFEQFAAEAIRPSFPEGATELTDLRGHLTDTFSFRGVAGKRGYLRGAGEDGGWFSEYTKAFTSVGLVAVLRFTGSYLPEENITCATEGLGFRRAKGRHSLVPLAEVPPVLLAECYADYAALAALGPFDPDYEKKASL